MTRMIRWAETADAKSMARYVSSLLARSKAATFAALPAVTPHLCVSEPPAFWRFSERRAGAADEKLTADRRLAQSVGFAVRAPAFRRRGERGAGAADEERGAGAPPHRRAAAAARCDAIRSSPGSPRRRFALRSGGRRRLRPLPTGGQTQRRARGGVLLHAGSAACARPTRKLDCPYRRRTKAPSQRLIGCNP